MKVKKRFEDYLDYLQKIGRAEETIKSHRRMLYGAISHIPLSERELKDLKLTEVQAQLITSGRKHKKYGPMKAVITFRTYLKFLKDSGIDIPFDWRELEVPKVPEKEQKWITLEEFNKFVEKINNLRDRALYECLFSTGARISELISLNKEDIDFKRKEAIVKDCKNGEEGKIYFSKRSLFRLKKYLKKRKDKCPALFISQRNKRLALSTARYNIKKYSQGELNHHCFRRSLATLLLERGATIKETQYLLRHRSERTTLRYYCKVNKRRAKKVHQRILGKI